MRLLHRFDRLQQSQDSRKMKMSTSPRAQDVESLVSKVLDNTPDNGGSTRSVNVTAAKARLWTGIGCVGTLVVVAFASLVMGVPAKLFPSEPQTAFEEYLAILLLVLSFAAILAPFDLIGGIFIPRVFEAQSLHFMTWLKQWSRSVLLQLALFSFGLFGCLQIGQQIGVVGALAFFVIMQILLLAAQQLIWQAMAGRWNPRSEHGVVYFVTHSDPRFTGGTTGLPGFENIVIPDDWRNQLNSHELDAIVGRRQAALRSGGRLRGIVVAILWNVCIFASALLANGATISSVSDLVTVLMWFLLFSFAGLLLLPTLNRQGVFALDQYVAEETDVSTLQEIIMKVDQLSEKESARSVSAESVFQPIPCPKRRCRELLHERSKTIFAWNVARTTLYLSWAFGGPLARAVHCNVGRPELWAIFPSD